jgi:hypothetical protein
VGGDCHPPPQCLLGAAEPEPLCSRDIKIAAACGRRHCNSNARTSSPTIVSIVGSGRRCSGRGVLTSKNRVSKRLGRAYNQQEPALRLLLNRLCGVGHWGTTLPAFACGFLEQPINDSRMVEGVDELVATGDGEIASFSRAVIELRGQVAALDQMLSAHDWRAVRTIARSRLFDREWRTLRATPTWPHGALIQSAPTSPMA